MLLNEDFWTNFKLLSLNVKAQILAVFTSFEVEGLEITRKMAHDALIQQFSQHTILKAFNQLEYDGKICSSRPGGFKSISSPVQKY